MVGAGKMMIPGAHHLTRPHEHRTDHWIGASPAGAFQGEPTGPAHIEFVSSARRCVGQGRYSLFCRGCADLLDGSPLRSFKSSSSSTMNSLMSLKERYTEAKRT